MTKHDPRDTRVPAQADQPHVGLPVLYRGLAEKAERQQAGSADDALREYRDCGDELAESSDDVFDVWHYERGMSDD